MSRPAHQLAVAAVVLVALLLAAAPAVNAVMTCRQVALTLAPCARFLNIPKRSTLPSCCNAIWNLIVASPKTSTAGRQIICKCISQETLGLDGHKLSLMASLAGRCRINIPYNPINHFRTDCSMVH